ncbi:hypothetical protein NKH24_35435 [Mesorhizobium sp. M1300]
MAANTFIVRHNGRRCFVPPCDEWDVLTEGGVLVACVSKIEGIDPVKEVGIETMVTGVILPYLAEGPAGETVLSLKLVAGS